MAQTYFDDPRKLKIKDFVITDEFEFVDVGTGIKDAIKTLLSMNCGVLLVKDTEKEIKGVLTERKILKKIADSDAPLDLKVGEVMDTHILKIHYDDRLTDALGQIEDEKPAAVVVVDGKGGFKGYFSPIDFLQAERMIKRAKKHGQAKDKAKAKDEAKDED